MLVFRIQEDPTAENLRQLISETDWPCVWSETFLNSSAPAGSSVVAFSVYRANCLAAVALASRTAPRHSRRLIFPSYPRWIDKAPEVQETFLHGLRGYCAESRIKKVFLNSYEAPALQDLPLGKLIGRHERTEYYVDLRKDLDVLLRSFSTNHRRNIRKAERHGFLCKMDSSECAFKQHISVFSHTQARREAREESAAGINVSLCRDLLQSGDGFLMQLHIEDETVSSFLILITPKRAFYFSGGTTEQGMRLGASHYLMWLAMKELKKRKVSTLSLGGLSEEDPIGLARYKRGFGSSAVKLSNARYVTGVSLIENALGGARLARTWFGAGRGAMRSIARFDRWILYFWTPATISEVALPAAYDVRPLSPKDLAAMQATNGRFADQARLYFSQRGITSAYGLFFGSRLLHVSWVYTAAEYAREPVAQLRLGAKEAEITNCFTLDEHRGQGLYSMAIRCISRRLFEEGIERIYMKTTAKNISSQRGILKAGLKPCGTVYHLTSPALSSWKGWYFRTAR